MTLLTSTAALFIGLFAIVMDVEAIDRFTALSLFFGGGLILLLLIDEQEGGSA